MAELDATADTAADADASAVEAPAASPPGDAQGAPLSTKCCSRCHVVKPVSEFNRNQKRANGLDSHCK